MGVFCDVFFTHFRNRISPKFTLKSRKETDGKQTRQNRREQGASTAALALLSVKRSSKTGGAARGNSSFLKRWSSPAVCASSSSTQALETVRFCSASLLSLQVVGEGVSRDTWDSFWDSACRLLSSRSLCVTVTSFCVRRICQRMLERVGEGCSHRRVSAL